MIFFPDLLSDTGIVISFIVILLAIAFAWLS
jgi:hypothetical protein